IELLISSIKRIYLYDVKYKYALLTCLLACTKVIHSGLLSVLCGIIPGHSVSHHSGPQKSGVLAGVPVKKKHTKKTKYAPKYANRKNQ
ncbi:hypothetical protein Q4R49_17085, partial [Morganella morganii subsp. sibonii]